MGKRRWFCLAAALWMCAGLAGAYEGPGFTLELPAEWDRPWQYESEEGNTWNWIKADGSVVQVLVQENSDQVNLYDWEEDPQGTQDALTEVNGDALLEAVQETQQAGVAFNSAEITYRKLEGGIPCLEMTYAYDVADQASGLTVPAYASSAALYAVDHYFTVSGTAADPERAKEYRDLALAGFVITEKTYEGPTPEEPLALSVLESIFSAETIFYVSLGLLVSAVAGWLESRRRKKRGEAEEPRHL